MPPQESGKTKAAEVCLAWRIKNAPAKMAFNTSTNESAKKLFAAAIEKTLDLLVKSNKDIDLVVGVHGNAVLKRHKRK